VEDRRERLVARRMSTAQHNPPLPQRRGSRIRAAVLVLLCVLAAAWAPPAASAYAGQAVPRVEVQDVRVDFPGTVEFTLKADEFNAERAQVNYTLVGDPVTSGVQADLDGPSSDLDLSVELDLSVHYIPPGTDVEYYWTLTSPTGETADTPVETFRLLDDRFDWRSRTDAEGRVTVNWYEGSDSFGKMLSDTATGALDRLRDDTGAVPARPVDIWVYPSQDVLLEALPSNIPEWVGGKAFPELALVLAAIEDNEYADLEIKRVVPHELSHIVLYQATRNPYNTPPGWLEEGIAVNNQESQDPSAEDALKFAAEAGALPSLKALSGSFGADEEMALLSYAQSGSVVEFILDDARYGPSKLARTVAAFKEGVTYDEALKAGLGITVDELDAQWRQALPYKPSAPGWLDPLAFFAIAAGAVLFVAGGVVAVIIWSRRSRKPASRET
jgi:hypothetical protein